MIIKKLKIRQPFLQVLYHISHALEQSWRWASIRHRIFFKKLIKFRLNTKEESCSPFFLDKGSEKQGCLLFPPLRLAWEKSFYKNVLKFLKNILKVIFTIKTCIMGENILHQWGHLVKMIQKSNFSLLYFISLYFDRKKEGWNGKQPFNTV